MTPPGVTQGVSARVYSSRNGSNWQTATGLVSTMQRDKDTQQTTPGQNPAVRGAITKSDLRQHSGGLDSARDSFKSVLADASTVLLEISSRDADPHLVAYVGSIPAAGIAASRPHHTMSEVEQPEDDGQPTRPVEKHAARLDSLEGWKSFVEEHVIPRIDELEATVEQRDERISELQARVHELETQLEALDGLADDEASTPQKRAVDLARAMIRQAETRADGRIAKDYNDVKEDLATLGHEDLHDPQAYQAMDDVTAAAGFRETTVSRQGKQVQAVGVNLDALGEVDAVNEIKNEHGSEAADNTTEPVTETTP